MPLYCRCAAQALATQLENIGCHQQMMLALTIMLNTVAVCLCRHRPALIKFS
jgi:hypothetical protein